MATATWHFLINPRVFFMRIPHRDRVKDPSVLYTSTRPRAHTRIKTHRQRNVHARTREAAAPGALVPHGRYGLIEPSGVGRGLKGGK